jgi:RHS repeat-associated protein
VAKYTKTPAWLLFVRGFTGHEDLTAINLINMNGRVYNPTLGMFLSPDNYVQAPGFTQNFNRYAYGFHNPLMYTDPDGESAELVACVIVGAVIGAYMGYRIGDAYDARGWDMAGYVFCGAVIGGVSGYVGGVIAAGGGLMANTAGIAYSSLLNSSGMSALSGGEIDPSISLGAASYNLGTNEWGYLGKSGNKWYVNVGYGFGALANISDIYGIYTDYQASQHLAQKGTPINIPEDFDWESPWKSLGTKPGYHFYGPSKTGWDPEYIRYVLKIAPVKGNLLDELAYIHDVVHYNNGTEGLTASLLSTNRATIASDFALAKGAINLLRSGTATSSIAQTALNTAIGMNFLAGMHTMLVYSYYFPMLYNH